MIGNGKKVNASKGGMPDAKNSKADAISGKRGTASKPAKVARMIKTMGGVVRATSHNYGMHGPKGKKLRGTATIEEEMDDATS